ncbi:MAG: hypothetical protein ACR2G7_13405, partial [Acidimicrobiales bacterium]
APNIVLFGGVQQPVGPLPTVTLPPDGSATPITATVPTGRVAFGPGVLFTSGPITVSTQGTTGPGGSVTSTADITTVPTSTVGEILYAGSIASSCTATETDPTTGATTVSGSTTLTGPGDAGHTAPTLRISDGNPDIDGDETYVDLPLNPAPNTSIDGNLESVGDHFTVVFNEQIINPDGSITVNAVHEFLLGPTLTGDLFLGQVVCGVTAAPGATTTSTTVVPPTSSTTVVPPTSSTTVVPPTSSTTVVPPTSSTTVVPPTSSTTVVPPTSSTTVVPPPDGRCRTPNGPISGSLFRIAASLPRSLPRSFAISLVDIARQLCRIGL